MTTTPQVLLDRYEVGRLLAAGGMAEVFEGRDRLLSRRVAIKVPLSQYAHDPEFAHRFRREPDAASLSHRGGGGIRHRVRERHTLISGKNVEGPLQDVIRAEARCPGPARPRSPPTSARHGAAHARPGPRNVKTATSSDADGRVR